MWKTHNLTSCYVGVILLHFPKKFLESSRGSSKRMSVAEFLKGLPSYNENNFTKFHVDNNNRSPLKRPSVYVPTKDFPSEQVIVTEKTSILLRYLHQHWEKKQSIQKKREHNSIDNVDEQTQSRKRPRTDFNHGP